MVSVRARLAAFTPLVVLTLLTVAAAVAGHRSGHETAGATTAAAPPVTTPTATAHPTPSSPFSPLPSVNAVMPTSSPVSIVEARRSWHTAIHKLVNAASGEYSWSVYYDEDPDPLQSETGGFDLDPLQSRFDRIIDVGDSKKQVVHVRRFDRTTYMQFDHWGPWTGCWLRVTNEQMERATGVDFSDSVPLPVAVLAIADARITTPSGFWFGAPYREFGGVVNAAAALQFLGVSPKIVQKGLTRLVKIDVPITVSLDEAGRLHGGGVRGAEVAESLIRAAPSLLVSLVKHLPRYSAAFSVKGLGTPVSVPAPPEKSILPPNPSRNNTCAAQGPRA